MPETAADALIHDPDGGMPRLLAIMRRVTFMCRLTRA